MKIGDSIKVKDGIESPDYDDLLIEGWVGRIIEINEDLLTIELDSITLSELKDYYIVDSLLNELDFSLLNLEKDEVEITNPRDSKDDVALKKASLNAEYSVEEEEKRINEILNTDDTSVNQNNLDTYYNYLKKELKPSCILTGSQDFDWEEPYVIGGWSQKEYKELKKTKPSYTDKFEFIHLNEEFDDWKGIYAKVKRLSDNKKFNIPLWDLKVVDKNNSNFLLVSDYSSWMTNYR